MRTVFGVLIQAYTGKGGKLIPFVNPEPRNEGHKSYGG